MHTKTPWARNLGWMASHDSGLRRRLTSPSGEASLQVRDGSLYWKAGLTWTEVVVTQQDVDDAVQRCSGVDQVLLVGLGDGRLLRAILERTDARVIAWDRAPAWARPALQAHDLTPWLATGRLTIALGADLLDHADLPRVCHPVLGRHYRHELHLVDEPVKHIALVVSGTLFFEDICEALEARGAAVFSWDVHGVHAEELQRTARRVGARVVVAINHTHGLAEACDELGLPLIEWEIDPSTDALQPTRSRSAHVFTWRQENVRRYRDQGYAATYLPLASNPGRRAPVVLTPGQRASYAVPVAYVGSSMVSRGQQLAREFVQWFARAHGSADAPQTAATIVTQLLGIQAASGRDYVIPELLAEIAPDLDARFEAIGCPHRPDTLIGEAAAASYRLRTLAHLAPLGLHIWGDEGWQALKAHGATWRGWAGHYRELNRIYCGAAVHVDVGRLYQLDIVPMRIFDVLACGGFVIAEHSEALTQCFRPGVEVETWRTPAELVDKVRWYQQHEAERRYIASAGRARVLRDHTVDQRLEHMLQQLGLSDDVHQHGAYALAG